MRLWSRLWTSIFLKAVSHWKGLDRIWGDLTRLGLRKSNGLEVKHGNSMEMLINIFEILFELRKKKKVRVLKVQTNNQLSCLILWHCNMILIHLVFWLLQFYPPMQYGNWKKKYIHQIQVCLSWRITAFEILRSQPPDNLSLCLFAPRIAVCPSLRSFIPCIDTREGLRARSFPCAAPRLRLLKLAPVVVLTPISVVLMCPDLHFYPHSSPPAEPNRHIHAAVFFYFVYFFLSFSFLFPFLSPHLVRAILKTAFACRSC